MKKKWKLLAPDWCDYDDLWRNPNPFSLWPIGDQPFIAHWMDRAVDEHIDSIELYVSDRPSAVRDYLNNGAFWFRHVTVMPITADERAPDDAIPLVGLPRDNTIDAPITNSSDLLKHWLSLNLRWLDDIDFYELRIQKRREPKGWIGPRVRIHPTAQLNEPYWIEGDCDIGAGSEIGPGACIGKNTIIDQNAIIQESIVLSGTMVGRNTSLDRVVVDGGLLLDAKLGCRVPIEDSFILSDLNDRQQNTPILERLAALFLFALASPIAAFSRTEWSILDAHDGSGGALHLKTGQNGCILARRWHWLKEVFKGRMRLIGILPRPIEWHDKGNQELNLRLRESPPGFLSLADLHDCHDTINPNEWIHSSYQALSGDRSVRKLIRARFWRLVFKTA